MLRHKRNKHGTTHPYPQSSDAYPPLREGYAPPPPLRDGYTPPPPPLREGYTRRRRYIPLSVASAAYIPLSAAAAVAYIPLSAADTLHCSVDTDVPDGYDPDYFMPWVHPFTSVISGPTGSGKSVFVR
jgi:hypothetical protein